ncbi:hypothetical protein PAAG_06549 [Paracoccidioides lutzii Pb01]|uniref:Uncharacterized protein n=1 Tax=Paracoccidioides lutzii (strain ATCC MYA-826 / Pb01) TaxID=502779 RepID=C1H708_PARBA|nr:hypothetical protein PAAG_06549 [Paracoccidioides lutzii Pb01]EEH35502.1 hypothetical protein PAAG_06549 [Paracoccidioides lutzii Pb01]
MAAVRWSRTVTIAPFTFSYTDDVRGIARPPPSLSGSRRHANIRKRTSGGPMHAMDFWALLNRRPDCMNPCSNEIRWSYSVDHSSSGNGGLVSTVPGPVAGNVKHFHRSSGSRGISTWRKKKRWDRRKKQRGKVVEIGAIESHSHRLTPISTKH